ncbi:MAG: endolytic transglycosylase MltG, partial [Synergistaceae bacterium]
EAIVSRFMSTSGDMFTPAISDDYNFPSEMRHLLPRNTKDRIAFLLPETYNLSPGRDIAKEFVKIASSEWLSRLGNTVSPDVTPERLLRLATLASIVEGEAKLAEERPILAGIFLKRMEKHMRLQSCATVIYCWEERGIKKGSLTYDDLKVDSPYNTYKNGGLPPGPISVPSLASWESAVSPKLTEYLFFFATDKGNHVFSKTYAEHVAKQKKMN